MDGHGEVGILKNTLNTLDESPAQAAGPKTGHAKDLLYPMPISVSGETFRKPSLLCPRSRFVKTWCII